MIVLPEIVIDNQIHENSISLVRQGLRFQDNLEAVVKMLKQDYPSSIILNLMAKNAEDRST